MTALNLIGLSMMLLGIGGTIIYFLKKSKFSRQNEHGVGIFKDFDEKLVTNMRDSITAFLGRLCVTFGTLSLMVAIGSIAYDLPPTELLIAMIFRQL
jgi:hypothetical protein